MRTHGLWQADVARPLSCASLPPLVRQDVRRRDFQSFFDDGAARNAAPAHSRGTALHGHFEDNDPSKCLMVIVNHNNGLAEHWEWSGTGFLPMDPTNDAFKLGINYVIYGLTDWTYVRSRSPDCG